MGSFILKVFLCNLLFLGTWEYGLDKVSTKIQHWLQFWKDFQGACKPCRKEKFLDLKNPWSCKYGSKNKKTDMYSMTFWCTIALGNKTVAHTFLPLFNNANSHRCQEGSLRSWNFATMVMYLLQSVTKVATEPLINYFSVPDQCHWWQECHELHLTWQHSQSCCTNPVAYKNIETLLLHEINTS